MYERIPHPGYKVPLLTCTVSSHHVISKLELATWDGPDIRATVCQSRGNRSHEIPGPGPVAIEGVGEVLVS